MLSKRNVVVTQEDERCVTDQIRPRVCLCREVVHVGQGQKSRNTVSQTDRRVWDNTSVPMKAMAPSYTKQEMQY